MLTMLVTIIIVVMMFIIIAIIIFRAVMPEASRLVRDSLALRPLAAHAS